MRFFVFKQCLNSFNKKIIKMSERLIYNYLSDDELLRISNKIQSVEKSTSGELVVSIKEKRKLWEKSASIRELAEKEFLKAGIAKTKEATGILIFIVLASKEFYILPDININSKVEQYEWDTIAKQMSVHFVDGKFCNGILTTLEECGKILSSYFPIQPGDVNELPDKVRISK